MDHHQWASDAPPYRLPAPAPHRPPAPALSAFPAPAVSVDASASSSTIHSPASPPTRHSFYDHHEPAQRPLFSTAPLHQAQQQHLSSSSARQSWTGPRGYFRDGAEDERGGRRGHLYYPGETFHHHQGYAYPPPHDASDERYPPVHLAHHSHSAPPSLSHHPHHQPQPLPYAYQHAARHPHQASFGPPASYVHQPYAHSPPTPSYYQPQPPPPPLALAPPPETPHQEPPYLSPRIPQEPPRTPSYWDPVPAYASSAESYLDPVARSRESSLSTSTNRVADSGSSGSTIPLPATDRPLVNGEANRDGEYDSGGRLDAQAGEASTEEPEKTGRKRRRTKGELPRDYEHRKYVCPQCPQKFARPSALATHILSHTKEKPFVCEVCERGFAVMSNLRRHMKVRRHEAESDEGAHKS
ncbi:zinc finger, C2H2-type domain containing protein [Pseudohyphozyma bogoriensis]|nr:zinc finger, C2H2-type domain containing protein [Pseudohyphozyma bogoriensis]